MDILVERNGKIVCVDIVNLTRKEIKLLLSNYEAADLIEALINQLKQQSAPIKWSLN